MITRQTSRLRQTDSDFGGELGEGQNRFVREYSLEERKKFNTYTQVYAGAYTCIKQIET